MNGNAPARETERSDPRGAPSLSVVVPVYNSAPSLGELVGRLAPILAAQGRPCELILVNDGSSDASWETIQDLGRKHDFVVGINLARNFGQHNALLCGIRSARYDVVVTLDDDLQNPPEAIPALVAALEQGHDVVYGSPVRRAFSLRRNVATYLVKWVLRSAMGTELAHRVSAFRAFRTSLREGFAEYHAPLVSIDVLLSWVTSRFGSIDVEHFPRQRGRSNYTPLKFFLHVTNLVTGFTTWPLTVASAVGFLFTAFGLVILAYVLVRYLIQDSVPGFPFLASTIAIFAGAQLFAIGILGEYLARIYLRVMGRPAYIVQSTQDAGRGGDDV